MKIILVFVFLLFSSSFLFSNESLFISTEKTDKITDEEKDSVTIFFADKLKQTDKFNIITSKEKTIDVVRPGIKAIIEMGKKNKVDKLLKVKLNKEDEIYSINVQLVDVKKGKNIYSTSKSTKSSTEFEELTKKIVNEMLGIDEPSTKEVVKTTPIIRKNQEIKKIDLFYGIGFSCGLYLPLDNKNSTFLKNDLPYFGVNFWMQNIMIENSILEIDVGYFSSKNKEQRDDEIKISSLPILILAGYCINLPEKIILVPKIGAGYWFQNGSTRSDGQTPDLNYPVTAIDLEIKYSFIDNLLISLAYRFNILYGSNEMYYFHSPSLSINYIF